jgi:hypothetical protein
MWAFFSRRLRMWLLLAIALPLTRALVHRLALAAERRDPSTRTAKALHQADSTVTAVSRRTARKTERRKTERLRHPQLDVVMLEQRRHRRVLAAVERPLILLDHDRVPAPIGIRQQGDQRGGFRTPGPRHRAALPGVEEFRHDHTVAPDQRVRLLPLPRPRSHRVRARVLARVPSSRRCSASRPDTKAASWNGTSSMTR